MTAEIGLATLDRPQRGLPDAVDEPDPQLRMVLAEPGEQRAGERHECGLEAGDADLAARGTLRGGHRALRFVERDEHASGVLDEHLARVREAQAPPHLAHEDAPDLLLERPQLLRDGGGADAVQLGHRRNSAVLGEVADQDEPSDVVHVAGSPPAGMEGSGGGRPVRADIQRGQRAEPTRTRST
jgi:hypothetical protein